MNDLTLVDRPKPVRLIAKPLPFSTATEEREVPAGLTVLEMVRLVMPDHRLVKYAEVTITNADMTCEPHVIVREHWHAITPKPGTSVSVVVVPRGGGGGGKSPLRTILMIAVMAAAFIVPQLAIAGYLGVGAQTAMAGLANFGLSLGLSPSLAVSFATGIVSSAISLVGTLLINAIAPPPKPKLPDLSGFNARVSPTLQITGTSNKANPYGPVPRVYGRARIFPPYAAVPYSEASGSDQYIRLLFDLGYGPLNISEMKIGTVPLDQFEGVEYEFRPGYDNDAPITLYSNTVHEDVYSIQLVKDVSRTVVSRADADEITGDISFSGLVLFSGTNSRVERTVEVKVEYRLADTADPWTLDQTYVIKAATEQVYRHTFRIVLPARGKYEVKFTRLTNDNTDTAARDDSFLSSLRSITYTPPTVPAGHALLAMRIKASRQLNGTVQTFSCVAEAMLPRWDGSQWLAAAVTRNQAWAALDVMRGKGNKRPRPDAALDLASWLAFANFCDQADQNGEPKFQFDAVFDGRTTVLEAVNDILATARATLTIMPSGKYGVVWDDVQSVPVQMFTPRNSWGFSGKRGFVEFPHALKCRFVDPEKDWSQNEVHVYADGYDKDTATLYETMDMFGVTRKSQAWRDGRYHMAVALARPDVYTLFADIEHLACRRGSLIRVAHDVPRWGLHWGRIKAVTTNESGDVLSVDVDETCAFSTGKTYAMRIRRTQQVDQVYGTIVAFAEATETKTIPFATPLPAANAPAAGDVFAFGEADRETSLFLVKNLFRENDLAARLELIDYAPGVYSADAGDLPTFDTGSTWPGQGVNLDPPKPNIIEVLSNEDAMIDLPGGGWQAAVRLTFAPLSGINASRLWTEVQVRRTGSGDPYERAFYGLAEEVLWITEIDEGQYHDLRVRTVEPTTGRASDWVPIDNHKVVGKTALPPDVPMVALHGNQATWPYSNPPRDFWGFRVLWNYGVSRNRATAISAHPDKAVIAAPPFDLSGLPYGTITVLIVAVDTSDNESANPAVLVLNSGDPLVDNVVETIDDRIRVWSGTKTNCTVVAGDLAADETSTFWGSDESAFWKPGTTLFWPSQTYADMAYETNFVPAAEWVPVSMTLPAVIAGDDWSIEYRRQGTTLFWEDDAELFWGADADAFWPPLPDWLPWPADIPVGREQVDIRINVAGGSVRGLVSQLQAQFDVPDIFEEFEDVSIAAGGTRLPITKDYRVIRFVTLTQLADGGSAIRVLVEDKELSGPLVKAYDVSNVATTAKVNAVVKGY